MNLHGLVAPIISIVNPQVLITVKRSTGYTIDDSGRQVPQYAPLMSIQAQIQSLTYTDLQQISGLNITGVKRKIYINGSLDPVIRARREGGDMITLPNGETYLVVMILEYWPDWSSFVVVLQTD